MFQAEKCFSFGGTPTFLQRITQITPKGAIQAKMTFCYSRLQKQIEDMNRPKMSIILKYSDTPE